MNFDLNDDQREVKHTAHDLLSQRSGFEQVRKAAEGGGYDESLWQELAELGWTGIGIDEDHGGVGLGVIEVALLAEELGYAVTLDGSVETGLDRAEAVLSAELTGIAQRALDMTVAYVKERKQFGQPVAVFQAVSHGCAEMFLETESARSATYGAATAADSDPENLPFAASIAKATAAEAGRRVTRKAIQLHGGIGFTWEADVHWLFKRAHLDASQLGSAHEHRARIARLAAGLGKPVEALR